MNLNDERLAFSEKHQATYEKRKRILEHLRETSIASIPTAEARKDRRIEEYKNKKGEEPDDSLKARMIAEVVRLKVLIALRNKQLAILRPPSEEDVSYRLRVLSDFTKAVQENVPSQIPFRFHGTSFINTQEILYVHSLSSSVDRIGTETSYDVSDQVSVTTPHDLMVTIEGYSDLTAESCCLPSGCVFVLLPKSQEEESAGRSMLMSNVDFNDHPEQLHRILCSPEVLPQIRQQLREVGMDPEIAQEFFHFAETELPNLKQDLELGRKKLSDFISYRES